MDQGFESLSRTHSLLSDPGGDVRIWNVNRDGAGRTADVRDRRRCNAIVKHPGLSRMALVRDTTQTTLVLSLRNRTNPLTRSDESARRGSTVLIHALNLALQHRQLDDAAVCLSQVATSREIKQMQLSAEPRVVEQRFT